LMRPRARRRGRRSGWRKGCQKGVGCMETQLPCRSRCLGAQHRTKARLASVSGPPRRCPGQFNSHVIPQDEPPLAARICGTQRALYRVLSHNSCAGSRLASRRRLLRGQPKAHEGAPLLGRYDDYQLNCPLRRCHCIKKELTMMCTAMLACLHSRIRLTEC
jgi:hypothetical protein